ncbi:MFS transporter [Collinsella tanakaei]|nr:MFS transporter [Collinsella tanakaei]
MPRSNKWVILFTIVAMTFMSTLDSSIVNIAFPVMQEELGAIPFGMAAVGPAAGALSDRIGSAPPCFTGLVIYAVGIAFTGSLPATAPLAVIVVGMLVMAVGTGLFQSPNNSLVMGSVAPEHLGFAGSVVSLVRYLGMSVGVSGGSALLYGRMSEGAGYAVDAFIEGRPDLFCSGFSFTFAVIAALVAAGAVLCAAAARTKG